MKSFKRIILTTALLIGGMMVVSTSEADAGRKKFRNFRHAPVKVAYRRHYRPILCQYYVYKWHCGCWTVAGKYSSYSAAKFRARQLACHGYRFNIKKVLY